MNYIDSINGYDIYEATKRECNLNGYEYPTFAGFLNSDNCRLGREECSMGTFDELAEWCKKN